jgi:hypothetical protein
MALLRGLMLGLLVLMVGGCSMPLGGLLSDDDTPKDNPPATYNGLLGQHCAIMVWATGPIRTEFNQIQLDLARVLQNKIMAEFAPEKEDKKKPAEPPLQFLNPGSVVRYQREHPEIEALPIAEVAPQLGAPLRLIYIEIEDFQIQSPQSLLLLKGYAKATLRVIEVDARKQAKVVLEEKDITAFYPKDAPAGVVPTDKLNERTVYEGTVIRLAERLAQRFTK